MEYNDRIKLLGIAVLILVAAFFAVPWDDKPGFKEGQFLQSCKITPGLDLRGGAELRLRLKKEDLVAGVSLREAMSRALEVLERRINTMGLKEPSIRPYGEEEIVVQVPGGEPHEVERVKQILSRSGKLVFMVVASEEVASQYKYPEKAPPGHVWMPVSKEAQGEIGAAHILLEDKEWVTGDHVTTAYVARDDMGRPEVHLEFDGPGKEAFATVTERCAGQRQLAVVLDGVVHSAPQVREPIVGGRARISGRFSREEASNLSIVLKSGRLPAPLEIVGEYFVGATLGRQSVELGRIASLIGLAVVMLIMVIYYRGAGLIACVVLVANIILIFGVMAFFGATLTLPGIAGIVLTMGMAVDANIIIFERIREEKLRGKPLLKAFEAGFARAFLTVLDANLTTFIAGVILYYVGIGPIQGFATTLMIGIVTTLFTAVACSKVMLRMAITSGVMKEFSIMSLCARTNFGFMRASRFCGAVSLLLCIGAVAVFVYAVSGGSQILGIEFTGGTEVAVQFLEPLRADFVRDELRKLTVTRGDREVPKYPDVEVQRVLGVLGKEEASEVFETDASKNFVIRIGAASATSANEPADSTTTPLVADLKRIFKGYITERPIEDKENLRTPAGEWRVFVINLATPMEPGEVEAKLKEWSEKAGAKEPHVKAIDEGKKAFEIKVAPEDTARVPELQEFIGKNFNLVSDPFTQVVTFGARVAGDLKSRAFFALLLSWVAMILYLWIRFELRFGVAAVVALIHDVLICLGVLTIVDMLLPQGWGINLDIGMSSIAAFLTIVGYSVNNSIVVFDRVRENLREMKKEPYPRIVDASINQTLMRCIMTALTTFAALVVLFAIMARAGGGVAAFTFPVLVGVIVGTYSSWFIAPSFTALWSTVTHGKPKIAVATIEKGMERVTESQNRER